MPSVSQKTIRNLLVNLTDWEITPKCAKPFELVNTNGELTNLYPEEEYISGCGYEHDLETLINQLDFYQSNFMDETEIETHEVEITLILDDTNESVYPDLYQGLKGIDWLHLFKPTKMTAGNKISKIAAIV